MRKLILVLLAMPFAANADPIAFGSLSSNDDGSTEIITDSLNDLEWLRWDVLNGLNYAQTLAAIGSGGAYEGWQIAGIDEAYLFVDAFLSGGTNACNTTPTYYTTCASGIPTDLTDLIGNSYYPYNYDYAWFLSDNRIGREVGYVEYLTAGRISVSTEWSSIYSSDVYSSSGYNSRSPIGWLMYREPDAVPEPGTMALFGMGLAGMGLARRRRKA